MNLSHLAYDVESEGKDFWLEWKSISSIENPLTNGKLEVLYRDSHFQIERVTHGPYEVIPIHRHPALDSYEFPLWGAGELWLGSHRIALDDARTPWGKIAIPRTRWHGGKGTERGGAFLSVQYWPDGVTGSVISSWETKCNKAIF